MSASSYASPGCLLKKLSCKTIRNTINVYPLTNFQVKSSLHSSENGFRLTTPRLETSDGLISRSANHYEIIYIRCNLDDAVIEVIPSITCKQHLIVVCLMMLAVITAYQYDDD